MGREQLIREAEAAEQLAKMISFQPDKAQLLALAARLRDEAATNEDRSWTASVPLLQAQKPRPEDR